MGDRQIRYSGFQILGDGTIKNKMGWKGNKERKQEREYKLLKYHVTILYFIY